MIYFLDAVFFAAAALTAVFFAAVFGLAAGFAAAFVTGFLLSAFRVPLANFTPASLARLLKFALRRAAVRFSSMFFLTAVSIALWASPSVAAEGLASKAFMAALMSFLVVTLRSRRTNVCLARLIADLISGIGLLGHIFYNNSITDYTVSVVICKVVSRLFASF